MLLPLLGFVAGFAVPALFGQWLASRPRGTMDDPRPVPGGARPSDSTYVAFEKTPIEWSRIASALRRYGATDRGVLVGLAHVRSVVGDDGTANNNPILIKVNSTWRKHWTTIRAEVYRDGRRTWEWIPIASFPSTRAGVHEWVRRMGPDGIRAMNAGPERYASFLFESRTSLREPRAFADALRRAGAR